MLLLPQLMIGPLVIVGPGASAQVSLCIKAALDLPNMFLQVTTEMEVEDLPNSYLQVTTEMEVRIYLTATCR